MTIVGGVALAASLAMLLCGIKVWYDPAWLTVFICGLPLLWLAVTRLVRQRRISSALLITIAMLACIYVGELFAAGEVAFIMALGALLEDYAVARSKRGIAGLISLTPDEARLADSGRMVPAKDIREDDVVRVLPGEKITVDGIVTAGQTSIDQSIITGESLPVDKQAGDTVYCGTMNCYGSIDIRATKAGTDTSLQKMIRMVSEAEQKKAPTQRIVDKWAEWLVPIALLIAIAAWAVTGELVRGVTVLVVFCPCALVLATPVCVIAGYACLRHCWHRTGYEVRCACQVGRGTGEDGKGGCDYVRQDGDHHQGSADGERHHLVLSPICRERHPAACCLGRVAFRASAGQGHSEGVRRRPAARHRLPDDGGQRGTGRNRRNERSLRQSRLPDR